MTRDELTGRLLAMPESIQLAECSVLQRDADLRMAKDRMEDAEVELTLNGQLDGKNAETRKAQLHRLTGDQRGAIMAAEQELDIAKICLRRRQNEFSALRAIARAIDGEETP